MEIIMNKHSEKNTTVQPIDATELKKALAVRSKVRAGLVISPISPIGRACLTCGRGL
jgi:hypothetical protein